MSVFSAVPTILKVGVVLGVGGAAAGVIAWGAQSGGRGADSAPAAQVAATATPPRPSPVIEGTEGPSRPPPAAEVNNIPPDVAALDQVAQDEAALAASGERCPPTWLLHESQLLRGAFCYPPSWKLVRGDRPILAPDQRPEGYGFSLLLTKSDPSTGRELARVSIQLIGSRPFTLVNCAQAGALEVGALPAKACFRERNLHEFNTLPADTARIIGVAIPHQLSELPEVWVGVEIADQTPAAVTVRFSQQDQREALRIVATIRFNP